MVLLHVKRGDNDEFLHECSHEDLVTNVLQTAVDFHNRRKMIEFVADNLQALAKYGPMRPEVSYLCCWVSWGSDSVRLREAWKEPRIRPAFGWESPQTLPQL